VGALALPPSGTVYLDADAFIYSVEKIDPYASVLYPLWLTARAGRLRIQSSELALLEVLVKPIHDRDAALESSFRDLLLHSREVVLTPIGQDTLEEAARLRAAGLKTPDAIHAATALLVGCALFVTNDAIFHRVPGLPVTVINDVIASP
jgi:predicted nucleic acid-binding protein